MERGTREIRALDGRRLTVWVDGEGDEAILIHAGTPEGGRLHAFDIEVAGQRGFTCVGYSRPGYANSDRQPGRQMADCASDVLAIVDALAIDSFFTVGRSGGGPHALACAALLPGRVRAAATVGSNTPRQANGLDWYAGMGTENLEEFGAAEAGDESLRECLEEKAAKWRSAVPDDVPALFGDLLPDGAGQEMTEEQKEFSIESMRNALATGIWGWVDDDIASVEDWGSTSRASRCRWQFGTLKKMTSSSPVPMGLGWLRPSPVRRCIFGRRRSTCPCRRMPLVQC